MQKYAKRIAVIRTCNHRNQSQHQHQNQKQNQSRDKIHDISGTYSYERLRARGVRQCKFKQKCAALMANQAKSAEPNPIQSNQSDSNKTRPKRMANRSAQLSMVWPGLTVRGEMKWIGRKNVMPAKRHTTV